MGNNNRLSGSQILAISQKYAPVSGVYFLIHEGEIVYVGQSIDVINRVATHVLKAEKEFDRYAYVEIEPDDLNSVEADYIVNLGPRYNGPNLPSYGEWLSLKFLARLLRDTPYTMNHINKYIAGQDIRDKNGFYLRSQFARFLNKEKPQEDFDEH